MIKRKRGRPVHRRKKLPDIPVSLMGHNGEQQQPRDRILRVKEMAAISGLSRYTIYKAARRKDGLKLLKLSATRAGSWESDFKRWLNSKAVPAEG